MAAASTVEQFLRLPLLGLVGSTSALELLLFYPALQYSH
ncbi:hypothetical protein BVRB_5g125240 [Beta vulgaris subsp. vulgaris]|uniref:Uncharacterized protein n=1 Tax=Beta vulgaris subsp. vulgaris TaxID=3555 RepID=A0A0J8BCF3_BETVV|nr:hypothetical protein BVRB_5g125240 [Beta vulgaris subsp. vulgaris]